MRNSHFGSTVDNGYESPILDYYIFGIEISKNISVKTRFHIIIVPIQRSTPALLNFLKTASAISLASVGPFF